MTAVWDSETKKWVKEENWAWVNFTDLEYQWSQKRREMETINKNQFQKISAINEMNSNIALKVANLFAKNAELVKEITELKHQ